MFSVPGFSQRLLAHEDVLLAFGRAFDVVPLAKPEFTTNDHLAAVFVAAKIARLPEHPVAVVAIRRCAVNPLKRIVSSTMQPQPELESGISGFFGVAKHDLEIC